MRHDEVWRVERGAVEVQRADHGGRVSQRWFARRSERMMRRMPQRRNVLRAACLALAVLCGACTSSGSHGSPGPGRAAGHPGATITVGSFNFPESVLLAYIYADALAAKGFRVRVLPDLGTRELVEPALMTGLVQLVPEYTGSALNFISLGRRSATSDAAQTYR